MDDVEDQEEALLGADTSRESKSVCLMPRWHGLGYPITPMGLIRASILQSLSQP
jgi:hypothetical protein